MVSHTSPITIALKNQKSISGIDLINALTQCINDEVAVGFYITNLIIHETVPLSSRHKARLINLTKDGQLFWARRSKWNEVRAWIRMLDKLES